MYMQDHQGSHQSLFKGLGGIRLWEKRHATVQGLLQELKVTRVMDMGCSEGKFVQRLSRCPDYTLLVSMDLDIELLNSIVVPNSAPELMQNNILYDRKQPLFIKVFYGNALSKYLNLKRQPIQAITLIEVIQHIPQDQIPLLNESLFGYYNPEWVIMTTPNRDFNVLFNNSLDGLRHWDHKFEWDRKQFIDYCQGIKATFNYQYCLFGVGQHVEHGLEKGYCSQGAVFTRLVQSPVVQTKECAQLVKEYRYPFWRQEYRRDLTSLLVQSCWNQRDQDDDFHPIQHYLTTRARAIMSQSGTSVASLQEILLQSDSLQSDPQGQIKYKEYQHAFIQENFTVDCD